MNRDARRIPAAAALLGLLLGASAASAQLSPGPLHRTHAQLEGVENCTRCHEVGRKLSADKCLACHTALRERVRGHLGLHATAGHESCEKCHVEHQGRDYQLVWWGKQGREAFDHATAGWQLEGKHAGLPCERCHKPASIADAAALKAGAADPARTFLGLRTDCAACHRDPHAGQLGADCRKCHGLNDWRAAEGFDHARTKYALTGRHKDVTCAKCHPALPAGAAEAPSVAAPGAPAGEVPRQWHGLRFAACSDCHKDPHAGRLGPDCAGCHTTEAWRAVTKGRFDHERTRYPLRGRHATVACNACHRQDRGSAALHFAACTDCHVDRHGGQFAKSAGGGDCAQCHTVDGYAPSTYSLERHAKSAYPLAGAHLAVPCVACHARPQPEAPVAAIPFRFASTRCDACHKDPHRGEATPWIEKKGCEACHAVESWRGPTYDHAATRFPLTARHAQAACSACHLPLDAQAPRGAVKLRGLDLACAACHRDPHAGQFRDAGRETTRCERCHVVASWRPERFDHQRDAAYRIDGAHARATCAQCHPREGTGAAAFTRYKPVAHDCADCHRPRAGAPAAPAQPPQEGSR